MAKRCKATGCYETATCCDGRCSKHTTRVKRKRDRGFTKKPRSSAPHMGVEIECFGSNEQVHRALLAQRMAPCYDGSLPTYGCEFKVCRPVKTVKNITTRLVATLQAAGAQVNGRCGIHIHLDMRSVGPGRLEQFFDWLKACEPWFYSLVPPSRRNTTYTQSIRCNPLPIVKGHYYWANYTNKKTVEIRLHPGSLNQYKVGAWVAAMRGMLEFVLSGNEFPLPPSPMTDQQTFQPPAWIKTVFNYSEAVEYLNTRQMNNGTLESYAMNLSHD